MEDNRIEASKRLEELEREEEESRTRRHNLNLELERLQQASNRRLHEAFPHMPAHEHGAPQTYAYVTCRKRTSQEGSHRWTQTQR